MSDVITESWNDVTVSPWHGRTIQEGCNANPVDNGPSLDTAFASIKALLSLDLPQPIGTILLADNTLLWSDPKALRELCPVLTAHFKAVLPATAQWSLTRATAEEDPDQQTLLFAYPGVLAC